MRYNPQEYRFQVEPEAYNSSHMWEFPEYQHQHTLNNQHALRLLYAVRSIVLGWPRGGVNLEGG